MEQEKGGTSLLEYLKALVNIPGPVGREDLVQKYLKKEWERAGLTTWKDRIGNLYGHVDGDGSGPRWAIVAHADSIGFLVQKILSNGFLKMAFNTAAGTPDARFLAGVPLKFLVANTESTGGASGFFGLRSGHLAGVEGKKKPVMFDDMSVDIGVDSVDTVRDLGIDVGTSAVFDVPVRVYNKNITGPSMDDRVGGALQCCVAGWLSSLPRRPDVTLISTVQEEIGMKGAAAAAISGRLGEIDFVLNLDVGLTGDIPESKNDHLDTKLGGGPIVLYKDFSIHYSMAVIERLEKAASKNSIPVQKGVFKNYATDGVHFFMHDMPVGMLAIPCRYTHTPFETIRLDDAERAFDLIKATITR